MVPLSEAGCISQKSLRPSPRRLPLALMLLVTTVTTVTKICTYLPFNFHFAETGRTCVYVRKPRRRAQNSYTSAWACLKT